MEAARVELSADDGVLIRAYRGKEHERVPIWFMRQAGRYLPEYRELRAKHSMLDVIRTPELAAEVTLQPLRRFPFDGAIIFADILNPLIGMGIELDFVEGSGPQIGNPIRTASDVERLVVPPAEENVGYTLRAIQRVRRELAPRGIPVLGFAGAPFTLSAYLIEGRSSHNLERVKSFMFTETKAWHALQEKLSLLVADYLVAQCAAGASAVQLFDSWVGVLAPAEYRAFVVPYLKRIIADVQVRTAAPLVYFSTGTAGMFNEIRKLGSEVVSVDWRVDLNDAAAALGPGVALQGNLDPAILAGPPAHLENTVRALLASGRTLPRWVFNLGHGILPHTPVENVSLVTELVTSDLGKRRC